MVIEVRYYKADENGQDRGLVPVRNHKGQWALHKSLEYNCFSVTHIPSGLALFHGSWNIARAMFHTVSRIPMANNWNGQGEIPAIFEYAAKWVLRFFQN